MGVKKLEKSFRFWVQSIQSSILLGRVIIEGKEFFTLSIFAHPGSFCTLGGYCMALISFSWNSSRLGDACILGTIYFSSIKIRWHRIYALFIHVVLVNLYRIPVVEAVAATVSLKGIGIAIVNHCCSIDEPWVDSAIEILLSSKTAGFLAGALAIDIVGQLLSTENPVSCIFFFQWLIFSRKFINFNVFLLVAHIWWF